MLSFTKLAVLALSATSAYAVSWTDVYNDLVVVDGDLQNLITKANQYPGPSSPGTSLAQIQIVVNKLVSDIDKAKSDASVATPTPPSDADAMKILNYLCTTPIYPDSVKLVNATKAKRDAINKNGATVSIRDDCTKIKNSVDMLADVLISRAPDNLKTKGRDCKTKFDALLNDCIAYFTPPKF